MQLLGVSGSLRRGSHNTQLLRAAQELLLDDAELQIFDGLKALPAFDEDDEANPPLTVRAWRDAIAEADAVLFATPEYNHSLPGQLKNAIDWASRPKATAALLNKPVAVVGASTGMFGAVWSQAELRKVLAAAGARVVPGELPVALVHTRFDEDGRLIDPNVRGQLAEVVYALVDEAVPALVPVAA